MVELHSLEGQRDNQQPRECKRAPIIMRQRWRRRPQLTRSAGRCQGGELSALPAGAGRHRAAGESDLRQDRAAAGPGDGHSGEPLGYRCNNARPEANAYRAQQRPSSQEQPIHPPQLNSSGQIAAFLQTLRG